jgi:UDP-N-acetylmuramoyl-L-alanyl-D-glutamate--2,6-diaminopimelate ligase
VHLHRHGHAGVDLGLRSVEVRPGRTRVVLDDGPLARALGGTLALGVTGEVHAENAAAAALAASALGYPPQAIAEGLAQYRGVPGRFELVHDRPCVVVDYAHTPDGLERTLVTARAIADARVWVVFGCGGERDTGKRAPMGAIADRLADVVVVTSDNPRREDPSIIADAIERGASPRARWIRELDRAAAIALAIEGAADGDVIVIAGKGHETTQTIGTEARPFADAEVCRAALAHRRR